MTSCSVGILHGHDEPVTLHSDDDRSQSLAQGHGEHASDEGRDRLGVGVPHAHAELIGHGRDQVALADQALRGEQLGQGNPRLSLAFQRLFEGVS